MPFNILTSRTGQVQGRSRDLMQVIPGHPFSDMTTQALRNAAIAEVMFELRHRANNNNEIDGPGIPDFRRFLIGDYLDGIDLSAIPAENGGTAGQAWNDTYKNNRITLSAFNPYKGVGDTEVTKNHVRFDFANVPLKKRMNPTDSNEGGYAASEVRAFLDGVNGDGTGNYAGSTTVTTAAFLNVLKAQGIINTRTAP